MPVMSVKDTVLTLALWIQIHNMKFISLSKQNTDDF